jgi:hypothetical protein
MNNEFDIEIIMEVSSNAEIAYAWIIHINNETTKSYPLFFSSTKLAYDDAVETAIRMTKNKNKRMTSKENL